MVTGNNIYIIAEAGVNHNGSLETALRLVDAAAEAAANAIKFQTFRTDKLTSRVAPKAQYQMQTTAANELQHEMLSKLELGIEDHRSLIRRCQENRIQFLSTPFDLESLDLLVGSFDIPMLKISSGDLSNGPLLLAAARSGKPVILSTGMGTVTDIEAALGVLAFGYRRSTEISSLAAFRNAYRSDEGQKALKDNVILLQCTTEYPVPFGEVNLRVMETLRRIFGCRVGLSDHSQGIAVPVAAAALGATVIEKHFTLDRNLPGPDHKASLEPGEFAEMIKYIRDVEAALGTATKAPTASEVNNMPITRKSLMAACTIKKGEVFSESNLTAKRPGNGISPMYYWNWLGKVADRDYAPDELIGP
jgi:N-acetylneuraminate synthase